MIFPPSATATQRPASHAEVAPQTEPTRSFSLTLRDAQEYEKPSLSSASEKQVPSKKPDAKTPDEETQGSESTADAAATHASESQKNKQTNAKSGGHESDADVSLEPTDRETDELADADKDAPSESAGSTLNSASAGDIALATSLIVTPAQPSAASTSKVIGGIANESSQSASTTDSKSTSKSTGAGAVGAGAALTPSAALNDGGDTSGQSQDSGARKEKSLAPTGQPDVAIAPPSGVPIPQSALIDASSASATPASTGATPTAEAIGSQQPTQAQGNPTTPTFAAAQSQQPAAGAQDWSEQAEENISRVTRGIQAAVQQNGGSVTLRVSPPDLGMVRVQMHIESGMVRAEIVAQHESVSTLLSRELGQLKNALEGQGLVVDRLSVTTMSSTPPTSQSNGSSSWQAGEDGRSRGQFERDGRDQSSQRQTKGEKQSEFERAILNLVA
jgi:flagellar hook-length control protein FliK